MVGILGIVEESGLRPLATADVGLGWQLADEPSIGRVNGNRLLLDVLALNQGFVSPLSQTTQVMIDVMLQMPIVPVQVTIQSLHRRAPTHHVDSDQELVQFSGLAGRAVARIAVGGVAIGGCLIRRWICRQDSCSIR